MAVQQGFDLGCKQGKLDLRVWYLCNVCRERLSIKPEDNAHKALMEYMKERSWGHNSCHERHSNGG